MSKAKKSTDNTFMEIIENMPVPILVAAEDGEIIYLNNLAEALFAKADANKTGIGLSVRDLKIPGEILTSASTGKTMTHNAVLNNKIYKFSSTKMKWMDDCDRIVISGTDITEFKNKDRNLMLGMKTDNMTGILDSESSLSYFNMYIDDVKAGSPGFSICYIDINDLRLINDTYGRPAGDKYILTIVSIIKNSIRKTDVFGRIEGDVFLMILSECKYEKIQSIMNGVCARLEEINLSSGLFHKYSISYGISEIDKNSNLDPENILNVVDIKMQYMKEEYKKSRLKTVKSSNRAIN